MSYDSIQSEMNIYAKFVDRGVSLNNDNDRERLLLGTSGLAGEAGEVIDHIKKLNFHGKPLDRDAIILELGDVLWYYQLILTTLGITWDEVVAGNIKKLTERYPEKHVIGKWEKP